MLRLRFILAALIVVPLAGLLWLDFHYPFDCPGIWLHPLAVLLAILAAVEVLTLLEANGLRPTAWVVHAGTLMVVLAAAPIWPIKYPLDRFGLPVVALVAGIMLAFVDQMWRYEKPGKAIIHLALAIFVMVYVGLLMSFLVQLRMLIDNAWGMVALLSVIVVVKLSDVGAYTFGRLLGRHKLSRLVSPGKTVEGAVGGIACGCLGSWLMFEAIAPLMVDTGAQSTPWWSWLAYGAILAMAGIVGDLAESLLKRDTGRKDSSNWLAGFGGVLDVLDSLLVAAPVAYLCWCVHLVGP